MRTPFSADNASFSKRAHEAAQDMIYPHLLGVERERLEFVDCTDDTDRSRVLDGEMAIDKMIEVTVHGLLKPITHTVQERFRRMNFARFRDITITEWNPRSNTPSELYKLTGGFFVYGYYDDTKSRFGEVLMVNTASLLLAISQGELSYSRDVNKRTSQPFLTIMFDDLMRSNLVVANYAPDDAPLTARIPFNEWPEFLKVKSKL